MSTTQIALETIEKRKFPYWKLYKGSEKVAQCDREENPTGSPEVAYELFEEELAYRVNEPGAYKINIYKLLNGDKGGTKYTFTISPNDQPRMTSTSRFGTRSQEFQDIYDAAKREIETQMTLKRIEEKLDALGAALLALTDDDKDNDEGIATLLKSIFLPALAGKMKAANSPVISKSGFASV